MDVTTETFEDDVVGRSHELPVVVDFWADWCGPCKTLGPVLEREVTAREGAVVLAKVDVDANPELSQRYGIRGIPAVKGFRNGHVVREFVGAQSPQAVASFLDALLAPSEAAVLLDTLREQSCRGRRAGFRRHGTARDLERILGRSFGGALLRGSPPPFGDLGPDHPLSVTYRRRLATALY